MSPVTEDNNIEHARHLNNKACCLIKRRNYDQAISNLIAALTETKKTAMQSKDEETHDSIESSSLSSELPSAEISVAENYDYEFKHLCKHNERENSPCRGTGPSPGLYIYTNPIFIAGRSNGVGEKLSLSQFSSYIIFNLALAHHLKCLRKKKEDLSRSLRVSQQLYELAFQMQATEGEGNFVLMTALLNNMSLVHTALNNRQEAEQYQQLLLSALLCVVDREGNTNDRFAASFGFQSDMLEGFVGNVVHLILSEALVAPAA